MLPYPVFRMRQFVLAALLLAFTVVDMTPALAQQAQIIVATGNEVREQIAAKLLKSVLADAGFKAQLSPVVARDLPAALGAGNVHVVPEVELDALVAFKAEIEQGRVLDQGYRQSATADPKYKKLIWSGMRRRWSGAVKLIKNMTLPESDTQSMLAAVAAGDSVDSVVAQWLSDNRARTSKWKSASVNWMKP